MDAGRLDDFHGKPGQNWENHRQFSLKAWAKFRNPGLYVVIYGLEKPGCLKSGLQIGRYVYYMDGTWTHVLKHGH